jgi:hypothetical protein
MPGVFIILALAFLAEHIAVGIVITKASRYSSVASFSSYIIPLVFACMFAWLAWTRTH